MTFPGILIVLASQAATVNPTAAYPTREVLDGFAEVCRPLSTLENAAAAAQHAGWQKIEPDPRSPIGELVAFGKSEGEKLLKEQDGHMLPMQIFQRTIAGEQLTLVLSGVTGNGILSNGCRVYDVGESREMPTSAIEAWLKRAPNKIINQPEIHVATWEPGFDATHDSMDLYFVPTGSAVIQLTKVSGIALKADFLAVGK